MAHLSNETIWNSLRDIFPTFASHTAKGTKDLFKSEGFEALKTTDPQAINDFFSLSLRVYLQTVNISHAKDGFESADFGESYNQPFGAIIQRMSVNSVKPVTPAYKNLTNLDGTPDPFVKRKPTVSERFFKQNFDYQSVITIPDDFQMKQIFISEFGMSEFMAGIMTGLQNGYTTQKFENKLEALNTAINSTKFPLKDSQKMQVSFADPKNPTNAEILGFILAILNVAEAMELPPQTNAFNAYGFDSTQDVTRLRLLVRPGWKNRIMLALPQVFHYQESPLNQIKIIETPNFGGIEHYSDDKLTTRVYPEYNVLGEQIGWSTTEGKVVSGSNPVPDIEENAVFTKDPNEGVIAMLADKGLVFESIQNPYTVEPIRNPRGLYTNYWASSPNNTIAVDPLYNMVVFEAFKASQS